MIGSSICRLDRSVLRTLRSSVSLQSRPSAFSPVTINGKIDDWYGLGPLSVRPEHQKKGVGQALARDGLHRLMSMKAAGCVVYGNPRYYGRFGFESDTELYYGNVLSGYLQRVVFSGPTPRGEVTYLSVIR